VRELNVTAMIDIMVLLLIFLLETYTTSSLSVSQSKDLLVPASTSDRPPADGVAITISMSEVTVNDVRVAAVVDGTVPTAAREGGDAASPLVQPLLAALEKEVAKQKTVARDNPAAPFTGRVNVVADKRVPYQTLMAVLYTAGRADLRQFRLLTTRER